MIINPHGIPVDIDFTVVEQWQQMGLLQQLPSEWFRIRGRGPEKNICLINKMTGIGDTVHSMPALSEKCKTHDVTFLVNPSFAVLPQSCGARIIDIAEFDGGKLQDNKWISSHADDFGSFIYLHSWCFVHDEQTKGVPEKPRFQQYADLIDAQLPEEFNFREHLGVPEQSEQGDYILFAPQSTSGHRTLHKWRAFVPKFETLMRTVTIGIDVPGAQVYQTLDKLIHAIDNAAIVVAVDNGVLALALALGKPTVALMGPTSREIIVDQFAIYNPAMKYSVVHAPLAGGWHNCTFPCNFHPTRGFHRGNKCMDHSDCMAMIEVEDVCDAVRSLSA